MTMKARLTEEEHTAAAPVVSAEYVKQSDGSYHLDVEAVGSFGLVDTAGLKSSIDKERKNAADLMAQLTPFKGMDATEAQVALDQMKKLGGKKDIDEVVKVRLEAETAKVRAQVAGELETAKAENVRLTGQLDGHLVDAALEKEIRKLDGDPFWLTPHLAPFVRADAVEGGGRRAIVIGEDGKPRTELDGSPTTIEKLVTEAKARKELDRGWLGNPNKGVGATGNQGGLGGKGTSSGGRDLASIAKGG